jgi:hypothetical protein
VDVGTGYALHLDGVPARNNINPFADHGFLHMAYNVGAPFYDYANTPTSAVWSSGYSSAACLAVYQIEQSAATFPNNKYKYNDLGPNSNSLSRALLVTQENVLPWYIDLQEAADPFVQGWLLNYNYNLQW